jgi:uncharacterized protein with HEPN domain
MIDDREFLDHIRIAATRVLEYTREGRDAFEADTLTQDAVIRNLGVIGEAVKNLTPSPAIRRCLGDKSPAPAIF